MTAPADFDTLAFVKRLSAAGMDPPLAALTEALAQNAFAQLATKADLRELELRLTYTLTVRMGAMIAGSTALTVAILGGLNTLS